MIGFPLSLERSKAENIATAARLASEVMTTGRYLESVLQQAFRFAIADAHLVYIEGEYSSFVCRAVEAALTAASLGKSESDIAVAIEDSFSAAIDAHLKQLAADHHSGSA